MFLVCRKKMRFRDALKYLATEVWVSGLNQQS
jgi:hypothetical protein